MCNCNGRVPPSEGGATWRSRRRIAGINFRGRGMKQVILMAAGAALMSVALSATAQKPIVYPAKGQSASQHSKDDGECVAWAKNETGVDPAKASQPAPPPPPPPTPKGGVVKGAAAGAAVGAIGGND